VETELGRSSGSQQLSNPNLSKYSIFNLFNIQKQKSGDVGGERQSHLKFAGDMTNRILVSRCKDILVRYGIDEQRSGSIKLPKNRTNEAVFILRELKQLTKSNDLSFKKEGSQGDGTGTSETSQIEGFNSQFMIDLTPTLIDLICSDSQEIRQNLKQILHFITKNYMNQ